MKEPVLIILAPEVLVWLIFYVYNCHQLILMFTDYENYCVIPKTISKFIAYLVRVNIDRNFTCLEVK